MNDFNSEAGNRIRALRILYGYTREKLAEEAGINGKFLYEVEAGKKGLSAQKMSKLAAALGVSMDYLATGKKEYCRYAHIAELLDHLSVAELESVKAILELLVSIIKMRSLPK